jgi:hypothetical protein
MLLPPGEPGERLFKYFANQLHSPHVDRPRLLDCTLPLLAATRSSILRSDAANAFSLFASYHRFFVLLTRSGAWPAFVREMRTVIGDVLQRIVLYLRAP